MSDDVLRWQRDARAAFDWLASMYGQAQTLWNDAERYFQEAHWAPSAWGGWGGIAMSQSDMTEWPFFYLKALTAVPKDADVDYPCTLPVFGISFYDGIHVGPIVYAGSSRWTKEPSRGHWAAYYALSRDGNRFRHEGGVDDPVKKALPNDLGKKKYPGIVEMQWIEVPLGAISKADQLKALVAAAIAMADDDIEPARAVAAAHVAVPSQP